MSPRPIDVRRAQQALARLEALLKAYPELRESEAQARLTAWLAEEQQSAMARSHRNTGDLQTKARVQRFREKRKQEGWIQYELWIDPGTAELLSQLRHPGESLQGVIQRALHALASVSSNVSSNVPSHASEQKPAEPLSYEQRKAALLTRLREMKAQGLSMQAIANQLNAEQVPTLAGRGRWHKGTIGTLLAQDQPPSA